MPLGARRTASVPSMSPLQGVVPGGGHRSSSITAAVGGGGECERNGGGDARNGERNVDVDGAVVDDSDCRYSRVPCSRPTFASMATNTVAMVPLLSRGAGSAPRDPASTTRTTTHSERSLRTLMTALSRVAARDRDADSMHGMMMNNGNNGGPSSSSSSSVAAGPHRWREDGAEILLVMPNSQLTRPGDWRYDATPLSGFDWSAGSQRLMCFDGRPDRSRPAHDQLVNEIGKSWTDLVPGRRTGAVIGILNLRDCLGEHDGNNPTDVLLRAEDELREWADAYGGAGMKSSDLTRDLSSSSSTVVSGDPSTFQMQQQQNKDGTSILLRMFVFDSFAEECQEKVDLSSSNLGSDLVAFPPHDDDEAHSHMMDLHLHVVMNDLAVAFFRRLETKIRTSDALAKAATGRHERGGGLRGSGSSVAGSFSGGGGKKDDGPSFKGDMGALAAPNSAISSIVNPAGLEADNERDSDAGSDSESVATTVSALTTASMFERSTSGGATQAPTIGPRFGLKAAFDSVMQQTFQSQPTFDWSSRLLTPLDEHIDIHSLTGKDLDALKRRDVGRREKYGADLALLAGSPLDAYERYSRAVELTRSCRDPLWYASSLVGCAASFVAMADGGGHGVDQYLENNFRLPDEYIHLANGLRSAEEKKTIVERTKTTLPAAVYALTDEALGILSRHKKLAPLCAELLLQLADYASESDGAHRMCRWGEGDFVNRCYAGEPGNPPRWETTSARKLITASGEAGGGMASVAGEQLTADTNGNCRKCCEYLHRAVSIGGLDPRTRADVAATAARFCLRGIKASSLESASSVPRLRLPRKAAFFTVASAEAMSLCSALSSSSSATAINDEESSRRAASLWLAASRLYSQAENRWDGNCGYYAWSTLRVAALHGLSRQSDRIAAEQALELLLVLLSEISPDRPGPVLNVLEGSATTDDDMSINSNSRHSVETGSLSRPDNESAVSDLQSLAGGTEHDGVGDGASGSAPEVSASTITTTTRKNAKPPMVSTTSRNQLGMSSTRNWYTGKFSSVLLSQSKWMNDDPLPPLELPLAEPSDFVRRGMMSRVDDMRERNKIGTRDDTASLLALSCARPNVPFEVCALAQNRFIAILLDLRNRMPTPSSDTGALGDGDGGGFRQLILRGPVPPSLSASPKVAESFIPPPLRVKFANVVKSESQLLLERTKAYGYSGKNVGDSMATFFNPYASKKGSKTNGVQTTLVAEGEERTVLIKFENRLSVPLIVPSCLLEFDKYGASRIEAPPLSFTVPPKSRDFEVRFPFIVLPSALPPDCMDEAAVDVGGGPNVEMDNKSRKPVVNVYELLGLRMTCLNRCFFMSLKNGEEATTESLNALGSDGRSLFGRRQLPEPASIYPFLTFHKKQSKPNESVSVRVESVPAQPNLLVAFTTSQIPLGDAAVVPVHLSDGEIYTIPPFRLTNDFGASGQGKILRLQVIAVGLPGLPDEVLFDTDAHAVHDDDDLLDESDIESEDFEELMECDGLPPLRMKALTEGLSLQSINDKMKSREEGSVVTFQIAAANDMGNQLANGGNVRIRFRYRGPSPNRATEIWRRREVSLRIVRVKGPRISSLSFRPDLSWGSAFSELSHSLAEQRHRFEALPTTQTEILRSYRDLAELDERNPDDESSSEDFMASILGRVGMDASTNVSGDETVVLMAVANETNSTIILSNRQGRVGGFEGSPMATIRVTSGVSVKIPVVIQRIDRKDENGEAVDIVAELIARTALQWESVVGDGESAANKRVRQGRVRIPSRCLREIIEEHGSFASRICLPPISLKVDIGRKSEEADVVVPLGKFIEATVHMRIQDWVPFDVISKCRMTLEFCCAREDTGSSSVFSEKDGPAYMWCGQLRRTFRLTHPDVEPMVHRAKISFVQTGVFAVSACVKITGRGASGDEVWWAPRAETVVVGDGK